MSKFDDLFNELKAEITRIGDRFLVQYFPVNPEQPARDFEYDVKSYCILTHASFEEFLEMVAEEILSRVQAEFLSKKISLATATLLLTYATNWKQDEAGGSIASCFDAVRNAIDVCKQKHSATLKDNHGFDQKYMLKVLNPVGMNVPTDEVKLNSVSKLASARGSFAHTRSKDAMYGEYKRAKTPLSPEDAKNYVSDCLHICEMIRDSANQRW
jgi:hypothetical protein